MHTHTFTTAEPGIDVCTDCDATQHNPHTAPDHQLEECACGRGLARFVLGDDVLCAACFTEQIDARKAVHA